jgi:hypothetical protein
MRFVATVVAGALVALVPAVAAARSGPSPGVHIDPGSPAGKVYVIPIAGARRETSGASQPAGAAAGANPPLFGSGITPSGSGPARGAVKSTGGSVKRTKSSSVGARARSRAAHRASARSVAVTTGLARLDSAGPSRAGGGGWLALAGGGALVLVLGGGGGLALRRRQ